ncbi:hypothetical protein THF5G08_40500 [Vibrio jasicida]|nr:hypothetical protein THF5G08_40500 [Vibrio jasicida]
MYLAPKLSTLRVKGEGLVLHLRLVHCALLAFAGSVEEWRA